MNTKIILFLCFAVIFSYSLSARKIYITRHGQVGSKTRVSKKLREPVLTDLGMEQAQALAEYLVQKKKFSGKIYVSPFYRTIQTGTTVAELLKTQVILEPGLQEIALAPRPSKCLDLPTIQSLFPEMTIPGKRYSDPWRLFSEEPAMRYSRVKKTLAAILSEEKGDILLVTHGGIVGILTNILNKKRASRRVERPQGRAWNCALFLFELDENGKTLNGTYTTEFMSSQDLTNDLRPPKPASSANSRTFHPSPAQSRQ